MRTELGKDASTTVGGTAEKQRLHSSNPSPSPWKSDLHAEERHVPIEVIEEYRIEEEEPEPARKASRPKDEKKDSQVPNVIVTHPESPEKRLPPPHAEGIRPAPPPAGA